MEEGKAGGRKWGKGGSRQSCRSRDRTMAGKLLLLLLLQCLLKSFPKPLRFKFYPLCPRGVRRREEERMEPRAERTRRPGELQPRPLELSLCPMTERNRLYYRRADIKLAG